MRPDEPKRRTDEDEVPRAPEAQAPADPAHPSADAPPPSKYVFKIVRADPKNDFDFENVADK